MQDKADHDDGLPLLLLKGEMENMGSGFRGDKGLSTANQELVVKPEGWSSIEYYKFSFYNDKACYVIVNGNRIPLMDGQGFEAGFSDAIIKSFIIVDAGITFNWTGAY